MTRLVSWISLVGFAASWTASAKTLALNWKAEPEFGGFYAANLSEHFKSRGLKVEITEGGAGTPIVQMVATGKVPYGIVSADEVIISQDRGTDVIALFAVYQSSPQGVMAHAERGFKSLKDVFASDGMLAIVLGSIHALYAQKTYPNAKVKLVPYLGGIGNFLNDTQFSQQCFVTSEPLAAEAKGRKVSTFLFSEMGLDPYLTVLVTRKSYFEQNEKEVKDFVAAVRAGWEEYLRKPEAANAAMNRLNPSMDAKTFKAISETQKPFIVTPETKKNGLGWMSEARWGLLADQLLEMKLIKKRKAPAEYFRNLKL